MKPFARIIRDAFQRLRSLRIVRQLLQYAALQTLIQGLAVLSGLIIVRTMAPKDYAYYLLAAMAASTISLVGDSGITHSMSALGSQAWNDTKAVGEVLATALKIRKRLYLLGLVVAIPIMPGVFLAAELPLAKACTFALIGALAAHLQLQISILMAVPRLLLKSEYMATVAIAGAAIRLALVALLALFAMLNVFWTLLVGAVVAAIQLFLLRGWTARTIGGGQQANSVFETSMRSLVWRHLPANLLFAFQGQLILLVAGLFGSIETVANIGALSRLGLIAAIFVTVLSDVIQPRLSRLAQTDDIRRSHRLLLSGLAIAGLAVVLLAIVAPTPFLWLLGSNYGHLTRELPVSVAGTVLGTLAGTAFGFNMARGWVLPASITIGSTLVMNVLLFLVLDLSTVTGVLAMNCLLGVASLTIAIVFTEIQLRKSTTEANVKSTVETDRKQQ